MALQLSTWVEMTKLVAVTCKQVIKRKFYNMEELASDAKSIRPQVLVGIFYQICASYAKQENNNMNNNMEKWAIPIMTTIVVHNVVHNNNTHSNSY